ncbi:MAG: metallophosphoesterase [Proteobacteria bacterium]|nr:metallophosphoesterase [Pseudomonadota bacterium]
MKIIAIGDIHERLNFLDLLRDEISTAQAVIVTGDLTQFGGVEEARKVLDTLRQINDNIYAQAGNLDAPDVETYLSGLEISLHGKGYLLGHVGIFGVGGSNPSPFSTPNEFSEESIYDFLQRGYENVKDASLKIMVPHMPPHNTKVDTITSGLHVGSTSVRRFIEEHQPDLCLTGHIHEAAGEDRIGKTHVLNPGPFYEGGFITIDIDETEASAGLRFLA